MSEHNLAVLTPDTPRGQVHGMHPASTSACTCAEEAVLVSTRHHVTPHDPTRVPPQHLQSDIISCQHRGLVLPQACSLLLGHLVPTLVGPLHYHLTQEINE